MLMVMVIIMLNSLRETESPSFQIFVKEFLSDHVCPLGVSSETILVGRGESYSLTFTPRKKSVCKVIYQPLSNDPTSCKTGLRFSCSTFLLPNQDPKKCSKGAKLATSARKRP